MEELLFGSMMSAFLQEHSSESKMKELVRKVVMTLTLSDTTFADLDRSKQGIGEIFNIQKSLGVLPALPAKPKKSDEDAKKLRIAGNRAYKAKDSFVALTLYSIAICRAESELGEEMALAFANRSAVTYQLQEYQNSINDIDHALSTGQYPDQLKPKLIERRGKCFLSLSQFQRATEDFKQVAILVLQSDINADKVQSLKSFIDLIADCQGKKDIPLKSEDQPKLTHGPSSYIQSASSAVDIKYSRKMGRHLVARVDIAPGDILAIEKPYAAILHQDHHWLFCHHCKKRSHSSIPCPSCTDVAFCSDICRNTAWGSYHSMECDILHVLNGIGCTGSDRLAVRTLVKATKLGETLPEFTDESLGDASDKSEQRGFVDGKYLSDDYHAVHNLMTHMEHRAQVDLLEAAVVASSLAYILKETTSYFNHSDCIPRHVLFKPISDLQWNHIVAANLLMKYLMILVSNGNLVIHSKFRCAGDKVELDPYPIGEAIYPLYSLLNHSCSPNTNFCPYNGDSLILYAIKPITKGQPIFDNYSNHYAFDDLSLRQTRLRTQYYFTCKCPACVEDWAQLGNMPEYPQFVSSKAKQIHGAEISKACGYTPKIFLRLQKGEMTDYDFRFLIKHLMLIHKHVKQPWKEFFRCEQALTSYFHIKFTKYVFSGTEKMNYP